MGVPPNHPKLNNFSIETHDFGDSCFGKPAWKIYFRTFLEIMEAPSISPYFNGHRASQGRELGTYAEIKWGGARPPKEYIEEMKRSGHEQLTS